MRGSETKHPFPGEPSIKPEWIRLPSPKDRCPHTGLSRSTLCELSVPSEVNGGVPPVKSVVLRKRGAIRGIRLLSYDSLMAYLARLGEQQGTSLQTVKAFHVATAKR